jgi:hypothetical protein
MVVYKRICLISLLGIIVAQFGLTILLFPITLRQISLTSPSTSLLRQPRVSIHQLLPMAYLTRVRALHLLRRPVVHQAAFLKPALHWRVPCKSP